MTAEPFRSEQVAFTVCARNFLAYALTLYESFRRYHPEVRFYVALCDEPGDLDELAYPFAFIHLDELGLPDLPSMAARYNITELNTAIKPFVFQLLFDRHPRAGVLYLDPDIYVTSRFEELYELARDGAECVLTPALTEPAEHAEFDDQQFLRYGAYNLGFCYLAESPEVRRVVWWWARRLEHLCVEDLEAGLFVDQKWVDLFPGYIEQTRILRHPGYNVAYWNLPQRVLQVADGHWTANTAPLRFFHFSGNVVEDPDIFSRHSSLYDTHNVGPAAGLLSEYRSQVLQNGLGYYKGIPYAYSWGGASGENPHTPASVAAARHETSHSDPHLPVLSWSGMDEYRAWRELSAPIIEQRSAVEIADIPSEMPFALAGHCSVCRAPRSFRTGQAYASGKLPDGRLVPNWREHLACEVCSFSNRRRACYQLLRERLRPGPRDAIYVTERVTPYFARLAADHPNLIGSEYLGPDHAAGEVVDGTRHEDVEALSFPDRALDLILSFDVAEHVPHEERAFAEFARCLRPGGKLLMTAPTRLDRYENEVRARLSEDGGIDHILEPEYHGNPVDQEHGSLCYRYYGWQVLDQLRAAGFADARILTYWSRSLRYYGEPQLAVVAVR